MAQQIRFFEIPASDYSFPNFSFTITDTLADDNGQIIADFMRNRNLTSSWITTGSADSNNTEVLADFGDAQDLTSIFLVKHNLKDFTLEYFNGTAWINFSTITGNALETTEHKLPTGVSVYKVRLTITGTMVPDDDKRITQFLGTREIGQLESYPEITRMNHAQGIRNNTMLSGKHNISNSVGSTSFTLGVKVNESQADVDLFESFYYTYRRGVMVYLNGGDQDQFRLKLRGYRLEDFYVVKPAKDYRDDLYKSLYQSGVKQAFEFQEVV